MDFFNYKDGELYCEGIPIRRIVEEVGTPVYIYSKKTLKRHFFAFKESFRFKKALICFSVKSLSNVAVLRLLHLWGSGFDIVSGGELFRVLKAGGDPEKVVFSGVGKSEEEIAYALKEGILLFNVESLEELEVINNIAERMGVKAPVSIRINPDVDPRTHPYISTGLKESKFGIDSKDAINAYRYAKKLKNLDVVGIDSHIGSQITQVEPFIEALEKLLDLIDRLRNEGINIEYLDMGGGLGIKYKDEDPPHPSQLAQVLKEKLQSFDGTIVLEPGRAIAGNAGILVTKVLYRKEKGGKRFVIVDSGMNDLIRPSFYNSYHEIIPVLDRGEDMEVVDVVGPICESGDFFAKDRVIPRVSRGDLLAIRGAGAYGFVMSSNYNSRPRPPEVLVDGERFMIVRRREGYKDLINGENIPGDLEP